MEQNPTLEQAPKRLHPTADKVEHLRHQIKERKPQARRIFAKSGTIPTEREVINAAGAILRGEYQKAYEANHDLLTGLLNRRGFDEEKRKVLAEARRNNQPVTVVSVDLDGLKETNDKFGHPAGDVLLKDAATALKAASREEDIIARTGGDEYGGLLRNTTPELAVAWKKRALEELETRGVRASIGLSSIDLDDVEGSFEKADLDMYVEKRGRKNVKTGIITKISKQIRGYFAKAA